MTVNIIIGDALEELRKMEDESADMCVCSPPYWGLRDYGVEGQLGLEETLADHIAALVELFEEIRRVLKPHGTLWLNYGDCYATTPNGRSAEDTKAAGDDDRTFRDKPFSTVGPVFGAAPGDPTKAANGSGRFGGGNASAGPVCEKDARTRTKGGMHQERREDSGSRIVAGGYLKPKDLCMIPNRLAIALQDAGWWVRSEIIWGKPNPMPDSSGNYRPSSAHEKIFLLAKSGDANAYVARDTGEVSFDPDLSERCALITDATRSGARWRKMGMFYDASAVRLPPTDSTVERLAQDVESQTGSDRVNGGAKTNGAMKAVQSNKMPRGHERPQGGLDGRWDKMSRAQQRGNGRLLRNYEPDLSHFIDRVHPEVWEIATAAYSDAHFATFPPALVIPCILSGCPKGGMVIDPFGGSGTTGLVAQALQRDCALIELNPEYASMAEKRIATAKLAGGRKAPPRTVAKNGQTDIFSLVEGA